MTEGTRTWQELCEAASQEPDPGQLMVLVAELMQALDERDHSPAQMHKAPSASLRIPFTKTRKIVIG